MIYNYQVSQIGFYHLDKGIPNQDSFFVKKIDKNFVIAAVADGLGSEKNSDIASKIAAKVSVEYCSINVNRDMNDNEILMIIKASFFEALNSINEFVQNKNDDLNQYDTTLSLALFCDNKVYFGQSGDSGILVYNADGKYEALTEKQNDENGCVFPLCFGEEKWEFGYKENIVSVLLATDGLYDLLFPYLLKNKDIKIYVALAEFLMNNKYLKFSKRNTKNVQLKMEKYFSSLNKDEVQDDKTIVVLYNSSIKSKRQDDSYYASPNWALLKEEYDKEFFKKAYPNLNKDGD